MFDPNRNSLPPGPTIAAFESLDVDPAHFDHTAHLFVAWSYCQKHDLLISIERYRHTLRRLTTKLGVPEKYHETVTWFFLITVAERCQRNESGDWNAFVNENPDLFERNPSLIRRFYSDEYLQSDHARKSFVLPDLATPA